MDINIYTPYSIYDIIATRMQKSNDITLSHHNNIQTGHHNEAPAPSAFAPDAAANPCRRLHYAHTARKSVSGTQTIWPLPS